MKRYKVILSIATESYVEADSWVEEGTWIRFIRHGTATAWFAKSSVRKIEDCTTLPCEPEYSAAPSVASAETAPHRR